MKGIKTLRWEEVAERTSLRKENKDSEQTTLYLTPVYDQRG